jgi:hypothetical protein
MTRSKDLDQCHCCCRLFVRTIRNDERVRVFEISADCAKRGTVAMHAFEVVYEYSYTRGLKKNGDNVPGLLESTVPCRQERQVRTYFHGRMQ